MEIRGRYPPFITHQARIRTFIYPSCKPPLSRKHFWEKVKSVRLLVLKCNTINIIQDSILIPVVNGLLTLSSESGEERTLWFVWRQQTNTQDYFCVFQGHWPSDTWMSKHKIISLRRNFKTLGSSIEPLQLKSTISTIWFADKPAACHNVLPLLTPYPTSWPSAQIWSEDETL